MKILNNTIVVGLLSFVCSIIFYYMQHNVIASLILIITAICLTYINKRKYDYYTNPVGIFCGIWFFTIGLSVLRLHNLQVEWKITTWICLIIAFISFVFGYVVKNNIVKDKLLLFEDKYNKKIDFLFLKILFGVSVFSLVITIYVLKYVPIFSNDMSAYHNYGVFGLRYLVQLSVLILPMSFILYNKYKKELNRKEITFLIIMNIIAVSIPFIIVARGVVLTILTLSLFVLGKIYKKKEFYIIPVILVIALGSWKIIGSFRNQSDAYLKEVLKIETTPTADINKKNSKEVLKIETTPTADINKKNSKEVLKEDTQSESVKGYSKISTNIKFMRTYMYLAMNYDNFDLNVKENKERYYGLSSLLPITFALTKLSIIDKNIFLNLESTPKRITYYFNTNPIVYTPYIDFGIIGVALYMFIIGFLCCFLENLNSSTTNILLQALFKFGLTFSFFCSYFAQPIFWVYIVVITIGYLVFFKVSERFYE